ncbi:ATP-binding protein [Planctomicrobium sp. SH668]|uniref:ATP-binding protein n=1 Tax=Planctomicrobium sp. SH668 TaxID=3448126 RepID=UPI003F5ADFB5
MAGRKITVVVSQAPGKNPTKRHLEEEIATQLMLSGTAEVSVIPNLYDLPADHHGLLWLKSISGDIVVCSWLYERATRWVLDRNGIPGQVGLTQLPPSDVDEEEDVVEEQRADAIGSVLPSKRSIYILDLRKHSDPAVYIQEIERIAQTASASSGPLVSLDFSFGKQPTPTPAVSPPQAAKEFQLPAGILGFASAPVTPVAAVNVEPKRRWYPVIDYSRCTNCMECIDFCLFGVYGVDTLDRILVEEQDNCKRGCPACSRVCPANAIIFPEHKSPAIAGAPTSGAGDFKIDLSKLFGAPTALEMAAMERDQELVLDGRDAVGMTVGIPKRQNADSNEPKDDLDRLVDALDDIDF